jgi:secreted PhoX family phosphatase
MMERRRFLQASSVVALASLFERTAQAGDAAGGPLVPDPRGLLDLPVGFRYEVLDYANAPMSDGYRVPARPDGMGCFDLGNGKLALMRNHETRADGAWRKRTWTLSV